MFQDDETIQDTVGKLCDVVGTDESKLYSFKVKVNTNTDQRTMKTPRARGPAAAYLDPIEEFEDHNGENENQYPSLQNKCTYFNSDITNDNGREDDRLHDPYADDSLSFGKIPMVTGSFSNDKIEKMLKEKQEERSACEVYECSKDDSSKYETAKSSMSTCSTDDSTSSYETANDKENASTFTHEENKIMKNAVFSGLIKNNVLNLNDLVLDNIDRKKQKKASRRLKSKPLTESELVSSGVGVIDPDSPDVIMHRFLYDGAPQSNGADFTVKRIGTKRVVTAKQQLMKVCDDDFTFIQKKKN